MSRVTGENHHVHHCHPDPPGWLGTHNAALSSVLVRRVARARATKHRTLGTGRRDVCDALDSHRILNREPKLRLGDHRVGHRGAEQPRSVNWALVVGGVNILQ